MLPAAQPLDLWLDTDNAPVISMHPAEDITGWTLAVEIAEADTGTVVLTLTTADPLEVDYVDASAGTFTFYLNPSDELLSASVAYSYRAIRTDAGARDVLAYGPLALKSLAV
jgi:hypothetical protein